MVVALATKIIFELKKCVNKPAEEQKIKLNSLNWKGIQAQYAIYLIYQVPVKDQFDDFTTILIPTHAYHSRMEDVVGTRIDLFVRKIA